MMTEHERRARRLQRKAAAENARVADEIPLFADQVEPVTALDEYWRWRRSVADGVERMYRMEYPIGNIWDRFTERRLRELAAGLIDAETHAKLCAYRDRVYPSPGSGYGTMFWQKVLATTDKIVIVYGRVEYDPPRQEARRLIEKEVWPAAGWAPPFTREQLDAIVRLAEPMEGFSDEFVGADL